MSYAQRAATASCAGDGGSFSLHSYVQVSILVNVTQTAETARAPRKDATKNREALLAAAKTVLRSDPDAPLESIAQHAGLTRRAVYGHFANRDDLVAEVLTRGAERITAALVATTHADPRVWIALIGARLWDEVTDVRVMAQLAVRGPFREQVGAALEPLRRELRSTVRRGIRDGILRRDIEAETLARLLEDCVLAVLDEATRRGLNRAEGQRLVMLSALSTAGLAWREAGVLIDSTPILSSTIQREVAR